jgi:hypothetical protein
MWSFVNIISQGPNGLVCCLAFLLARVTAAFGIHMRHGVSNILGGKQPSSSCCQQARDGSSTPPMQGTMWAQKYASPTHERQKTRKWAVKRNDGNRNSNKFSLQSHALAL